jgi:UDP-N-acetylglucosamine acyltransferase
MNVEIHPSAVVDSGAEIADGVVIGPHAIIEDDVIIGEGCSIGPGAHLACGTRLGRDVKIFSYAILGSVPQDLKFGNERTFLEVGDRTVIREFATLNRGTSARGKSAVGADCMLMSYTHVAHDCLVGDNVILANAATLAGHVTIEDWVIVGGLVPIHQFVRIGCHVMVGGGWRVPKDIPPYTMAVGNPLKPVDINKIGLSRRGFSEDQIKTIRRAYKTLFRSDMNMTDALAALDDMGELGPDVDHLKNFIRTSDRGVIM